MARPNHELIRGVPLFAGLDDKSVERLASEFIERSFEEGQEIASEGTGGLNFFVVDEGEAAVSVHGNEVGTLGPGASFLKATGAGVIHEHAAHQLGRHAIEMRAILPSEALCGRQPNKCFVDERRRLKSMVAPFAGHVAPRQSPELGVDERQQLLERLLIAVAPGSKQMRDLPR